MSKDKKNKPTEVTRRQFLAGTGVVVGGAAIGSTALLAACGGDGETKTVTQTQTVTTTVQVPGVEVPGIITLSVNGQDSTVKVEPDWSLAFVLREKLGLVGLKQGCGLGECGTCTVVVDGRAVYSCMILAVEAEDMEIETIEGLSDGITLHPIQQSFVDYYGSQCGYCAPGFIMAAKALLDENPNPTFDEVREGLSGHLCMCGNMKYIIDAVYEGGS